MRRDTRGLTLSVPAQRKSHVRIRQSSASRLGREGSPEHDHAGPRSGTSSLQNYEKINVHCLRPAVCGALLWQPL